MLTFTFTMELKADDNANAAALADALVAAAHRIADIGITCGFVEDCGEVVASWDVTKPAATPECDWCGGPLIKPVKSKSMALTFCTAECKATLDNAKVVPGGAV